MCVCMCVLYIYLYFVHELKNLIQVESIFLHNIVLRNNTELCVCVSARRAHAVESLIER